MEVVTAVDCVKDVLLPLLPDRIAREISKLPDALLSKAEDLRFRAGQPVQICGAGFDTLLDTAVTQKDCDDMLVSFSQNSLYAAGERLKQGFFPLPMGMRAGFCGRFHGDGENCAAARTTFFCVRIAREARNAAKSVIPIITVKGRAVSALVISPPGCGKTTMLRDAARRLSDGVDCKTHKVAVVDERSEIAGCDEGIPTLYIGKRTDVIDGASKSVAVELLLRAMAPDVIVTDEIGKEQDVEALLYARSSGAVVIASAHGAGINSVGSRPPLRRLFEERMFERYVVLERGDKPGVIEGVYNSECMRIREVNKFEGDCNGLAVCRVRSGRQSGGTKAV